MLAPLRCASYAAGPSWAVGRGSVSKKNVVEQERRHRLIWICLMWIDHKEFSLVCTQLFKDKKGAVF